MSDDSKKTILARRAKFIAAAVASVGIACGKTQTSPEPCLSVSMDYDAAPVPMPCLAPMPYDAGVAGDAGVDAGSETGTGESDGGRRPPRVVTPAPTPIPMPCLSVRPPSKEPRKQ